MLGPGAEVTGNEGFDRGPIALRVTVHSDREVYAILLELAQIMVELEALNVLIQLDGLLVLCSDEPRYTVSRIFPKLFAQRPMLEQQHTASSVCSIVTVAVGVVVITHEHTWPPQGGVSQIADLLGQRRERGRATDLPARDTLLQDSLSGNVARGVAAVFDRVHASIDMRRAGQGRFVP